jgi:hypothetical protein
LGSKVRITVKTAIQRYLVIAYDSSGMLLKVKETVSATSCLLKVDCEGEEETLIGENDNDGSIDDGN